MTDSQANPQEEPTSLPAWKKVAFVVALLLGFAGLAWTRSGDDEGSRPQGTVPAGGTGDVVPNSFANGGPLLGETGSLEGEPASPWAPLLMKGGLSFAVAFAAGYALRTFLKLSIVIAGIVALAIFGLQKAGIVGEIDWAVAQGHWDSLTANLGRQFESFQAFVTGSVPSAGAGTVGLVSGFRR
jgi:uncharacterized membrane protein (Fun14 family)